MTTRFYQGGANFHNNLGADPGFFLGGGAPLRNSIANTNEPHSFCRIPVVLESRRSSQGGVRTPRTLPLDLPLQLVWQELLYTFNSKAGVNKLHIVF